MLRVYRLPGREGAFLVSSGDRIRVFVKTWLWSNLGMNRRWRIQDDHWNGESEVGGIVFAHKQLFSCAYVNDLNTVLCEANCYRRRRPLEIKDYSSLFTSVHRLIRWTTHKKKRKTEQCPLNLEGQNYVLVSSVPSYNPQTTFWHKDAPTAKISWRSVLHTSLC